MLGSLKAGYISTCEDFEIAMAGDAQIVIFNMKTGSAEGESSCQVIFNSLILKNFRRFGALATCGSVCQSVHVDLDRH